MSEEDFVKSIGRTEARFVSENSNDGRSDHGFSWTVDVHSVAYRPMRESYGEMSFKQDEIETGIPGWGDLRPQSLMD